MCQAVRDGGRRCPVHRHDSNAVIALAAASSGLSRRQTERLFSELRREGRHSRRMSAAQRERFFNTLRTTSTDNPDITATVTSQLTRSLEHETEVPDGATGYAQRLLVERAKTRGEALAAKFQEIAERTGLTTLEIERKFDDYVDEVDIRRGQTTQSEYYNQNTRRRAVLANLPYDRASVIAYGRLEELVQPEQQRRVTLTQNPNENSHIQAYGYDETDGRMEIVFRSNPDNIYAYHDVPPAVWEQFVNSSHPGVIYHRQIRGNEEYRYASREESEASAYRTRCASCGQFATPGHHTCPESEYRAAVAADPTVTVEQIQETVSRITENETDISEAEQTPVEEQTPAQVTEAPAASAIEEEPAPRRRRGRRAAAAEQEDTPANPETPVTPLPALQEVRPAGTERSLSDPDLVANGGTIVLLPLPELPSNNSFTEETQRQPVPYDSTQLTLKTYADENFRRYRILNPSGGIDLTQDMTTMNDEEWEKFTSAPEHLRYIVGQNLNRDGKYQVLDTYDDRVYSASTGYASRHSDSEFYNRDLGYAHYYATIRRRGYYPDIQQLTEEEHASQLEQENRTWNQLIASEEVIKVAANTTSTRSYIMDANFRSAPARRRGSYSQPAIQLGRVSQVRAALRDNKAFAVPVGVSYAGTTMSTVDDQGFEIGNPGHSIVSGEMVFRRNSDGVIEVLSTPRKLACTCAKYRRNYHCEHVDHVQRHMGNVIQQQVPAETMTSSRARSVHRLLPASILSRGDATVVEREDGEPYLSFGSELPTGYRERSTNSRWEMEANHMLLGPDITLSDPPTVEEREALFRWTQNSRIMRVDTPRSMGAIRQALRRSDVEIPVSAEYSAYTNNDGTRSTPRVTGTITYTRTPAGTDFSLLPITSNTLRCTCADYQENYDCPHVRELKRQSFALLHTGRAPRERVAGVSTQDLNRQYDALIREESDIQYAMQQRNMNRTEAEAWIADEATRRAVERQEMLARRQEQERQRALAEAERLAEEARRMEEQNAPTIAATKRYVEERLNAWNTVEPGYTDNPDKLYEDTAAALSRKRKGQSPIPFRTENVTDGICAPVEGARRFGIELEFDIKSGVNERAALRKIGQELQEAGLTRDSRQTGYHTARSTGWQDWSFENDCTVAGELVSPILSDTPEHWEQIRKACEIITRNGGVATTRTGSHVHISSASFGMSTAKHAEVLRTVGQNEDIVYRLASNPATGRHRGTQWCAPNVMTASAGDVDEEVAASHRVLGYHTDHGHAVNFEGSGSTRFERNQIEYRMWDATLDPGVIQQQIVLSAAITDYAERNVIKNKGSKKPTEAPETIGTHKAKEAAIPATVDAKEKAKQVNQKVAVFFDQLFRRSEDRAAAASLFAITNWQ